MIWREFMMRSDPEAVADLLMGVGLASYSAADDPIPFSHPDLTLQPYR
jgi:hypothetical protein